ncbi:MAG: aspartate carbamoyltransferase [Longimicrobiales bacterium]
MEMRPKATVWIAVLILGCGGSDQTAEQHERREQVAATGATIMPFDLDATTHVFEKTANGGLQQVVSDEADPNQIALIRDHLQEEAGRFASGDFHDPAMIHGEGMPGLHALVVGHERLVIKYDEIVNGAQITYSTEDAELVTGLHEWFDAQVSDHGDHAQSHR